MLLAGAASAQVAAGGGRVAGSASGGGLVPNILQVDPNAPTGLLYTLKNRTKVVPPQFAKGEPVVLEADEMGYDKNADVAVARGHVVVTQGPNILNADEVIYYRQTDIVEAKGHVAMLQPSGDVYFADHARLTDTMKRGVLDAFKARLNDNSVYVANRATRQNPAVTRLDHSVFTPCKICQGIAPFWDVRAGATKIDENDQRVYSHDAWLDMFGVPVGYTPYFSTPTPDAEARSGLLPPNYEHSSQLGPAAAHALLLAHRPQPGDDHHPVVDGGRRRGAGCCCSRNTTPSPTAASSTCATR
ncbi:MAG: LptA/OstA family protein [Alphaproteobacteria bacterium]